MGPAGLHPLANPARVIPPTVASVVHNAIGQEYYLTPFPYLPPTPLRQVLCLLVRSRYHHGLHFPRKGHLARFTVRPGSVGPYNHV